MISGLDRKNCWTIAEHRGDATHRTACSTCWRARNGTPRRVRDDLRDYVIDAFGDPGAILVVDLCRPRNYAEARVG